MVEIDLIGGGGGGGGGVTRLVSGGNRPDWLGGVVLTSLASGGNRPDWHADYRLEIKINLTR